MKVYLVIENTVGLPTKQRSLFCKRSKRAGKMLPLDSSTRDWVQSVTIIPLVESGLQWYTAQKLHERPHYMVSKEELECLFAQCKVHSIEIIWYPVCVPHGDGVDGVHWLKLKELLERDGLVNIRGNIVMTCGYSGQNMLKKRSRGGKPRLTTTHMTSEVSESSIAGLKFITERVGDDGFLSKSPRSVFSSSILQGNYFEAYAVAVTRSVDLKPHMDRENDSTEGFDVMGAVSFSGVDSRGAFRVAIFGYTRKCVGDYFRWVSEQ
tara:strand:+ start:1582 stop:2376 length:795 start_codon:yes stop_codon:yes gene_type:complete